MRVPDELPEIEGHVWMTAKEAHERLTPTQSRDLYGDPLRPRDRFIEDPASPGDRLANRRTRWVAVPETLLAEGG